MELKDIHWKLPVALGMVVCSSVPIVLLFCVDYVEFHNTVWVHGHYPLAKLPLTFQACYRVGLILPILTTLVAIWFGHYPLAKLPLTFQACYRVGLSLPILTTFVAIWFASGKCVTVARLMWVLLILIVLHLLWLSYGILALYFTNQSFVT